MSRFVIIGGGVIGAACAYYLSRAGGTVTIVDQGRFGKGCSHGNCGIVCPSHVLPLAVPGAMNEALRALFARNSPLSIKPRFDPALWSWLLRFARRCNVADMLQAGRAIQPLLDSSRRLFDELMATETLDCEWQTHGLLFVLRTRRAMEHYAKTVALQREAFGLCPTRYDDDELLRLEPALRSGLAGGWHYRTDAHLRPDRLMAAWRRVLERRGVRIGEGCSVQGFVGERDQARAAVTAEGEMAADGFVVAAGALTPTLQEQLGCRLPIQPGKGYSITMGRPAACPVLPMILEEDRVAVTPTASCYRLGSTMEFAGYDSTLNRRRLALLTDGARRYLREPIGQPVEEEWFGWRPMTPDSVPIIDRSPKWRNVLIAAGHNMLGLSMAPATGKLVAELLSDQTAHLDVKPYAVSRFR